MISHFLKVETRFRCFGRAEDDGILLSVRVETLKELLALALAPLCAVSADGLHALRVDVEEHVPRLPFRVAGGRS